MEERDWDKIIQDLRDAASKAQSAAEDLGGIYTANKATINEAVSDIEKALGDLEDAVKELLSR